MLKIGCTKVDITPDFPVFLCGYGGRNQLSDCIDDRLSAGVVVLAQGRRRQLLLTIDSTGIGMNDCRRIYADLRKATGFKEEQIYLSCSHTHWAPGLSDYFVTESGGTLEQGKYPADQAYYALLLDRLVEGVRIAEERLEPADVEETSIQLPSLILNRRTIRRDNGLVEMNYEYPEHPEQFIFREADPNLVVWRFRAKDGRLLGIIGRFGCHAVTHGEHYYGVSADYPGYFQSIVEREFGCPGLFLLGCAGDVVPMQRHGESRRDIGEILVRSIRMAERTFQKAGDFTLAARTVTVPVTLRIKCRRDKVDEILEAAFAENRRKPDFEKITMTTYAAEFATSYPTDRVELPIHLMRLGTKILVGMPVETFSEINLRLCKACPNVVMTTLTGGYEGYMPLAKDYRRGGYEVTMGARFNHRAGDDLLAAAIKAVREFEQGE